MAAFPSELNLNSMADFCMMENSVREREAAKNNNFDGYISDISELDGIIEFDADSFQDYHFWSSWQQRIHAIIDSNAVYPTDLPTNLSIDRGAAWWYSTVLGTSGFTRKYPAVITGRYTATLADGSTASTDDIAWTPNSSYTDSSGIASISWYQKESNGRGYLVKWDGSEWIPIKYGQPKIITAYGYAQAGDYLGDWLYSDLKNLMNKIYLFRSNDFYAGAPTCDPMTQTCTKIIGSQFGYGSGANYSAASSLAASNYSAMGWYDYDSTPYANNDTMQAGSYAEDNGFLYEVNKFRNTGAYFSVGYGSTSVDHSFGSRDIQVYQVATQGDHPIFNSYGAATTWTAVGSPVSSDKELVLNLGPTTVPEPTIRTSAGFEGCYISGMVVEDWSDSFAWLD